MNREHHRWYSPSLNRDMELLVFGHAGARVIIFPTSKGRFYEWEDRGMIHGALREPLERGWLQAYCVDAIDLGKLVCLVGASQRTGVPPSPIHRISA